MNELNGKCLLIESVQEDGRPFRPSDWVERLSGILAVFGPDQRLHYAPGAQPVMRGKVKCLAVNAGLRERDPASYAFILKFAHDNALRVREEPVPRALRHNR